MEVKQCIILAGGQGSRLGNLTKKCPKPLVKIEGKPFLFYLINNLKLQGFSEFIILTHYLNKNFVNYFRENFLDTDIKIIKEKEKLGTGGSIRNAYKFLDNEFLVLNGDTLFDINLRDLIFFARKAKAKSFIALIKSRNHKEKYSYSLNLDGRVESYKKEKKSIKYVSGGVYYFKKNSIQSFPKKQLDLDQDVLLKFFKNKSLYAKFYKNSFIDIGSVKYFKKSQNYIPNIINKSVCFLDRDGVLNYDYGYVATKSRFKWKKNVIEAIKFLNKHNYYVIVVTNQAGIGKGFYSERKLLKLHYWINERVYKAGGYISKFYYSPFYKNSAVKKYRQESNLRKPKPGMLIKAFKEFKFFKKKNTFLIGDNITDIEAGKNFNIDSYFVEDDLYKQVVKILKK